MTIENKDMEEDKVHAKLVLAIVVPVLGLAISWGTLKAENSNQSKDILDVEDEIKSTRKVQTINTERIARHATEIAVIHGSIERQYMIIEDNTEAVEELSDQFVDLSIILNRIANKLNVNTEVE